MDTLIIELINPKAYKLLKDMEELKLIRVLKNPGKLSSLRQQIKVQINDGDIDEQLKLIRKEWERGI